MILYKYDPRGDSFSFNAAIKAALENVSGYDTAPNPLPINKGTPLNNMLMNSTNNKYDVGGGGGSNAMQISQQNDLKNMNNSQL